MFSLERAVWDLACELAETGEFANITMIERELSLRGISHGVTENAWKRQLLTRTCHAARSGHNVSFAAIASAHSRSLPA